MMRKMMIALAIMAISGVAATTEASARGWGHGGGFYGRGFYGPGFGYYGYPFGYGGGPGGWGYRIPYEEQYSESGPACYRELRGRVHTSRGWRNRYVTICPGAR